MAGQAGLHRDLGGFGIADLTDHDDIGVLSQYGAQPAGKGHPDLGVDLGLADPVDGVFNRVFYGQDVSGQCVEPIQARIERGRLAGTGRACHQHHAIRLRQRPLIRGEHLRRHAQILEPESRIGVVEQAQNHAFAIP